MYAMARFATRAARFAGRALRRAPRALYRPRRPRVIRRKKTANKVHSFVRWCDKDTLYPTAIQGPSFIFETALTNILVIHSNLTTLSIPQTLLIFMIRIRLTKSRSILSDN